MTDQSEVDPRAIRVSLEISRECGLQFTTAWDRAVDGMGTKDDKPLLAFIRGVMQSAYNDDASPRGRCLVPEPDSGESRAPYVAPDPSSDHKRCQSGDACDRVAVRGRFGRTFCDRHGAELQRIGAEVQDYTERHNPRKHGNTSIIGYKRHVAA